DAVCLRFINDDYKFLVNFNRDEEVFKYFPSIMQPSLKTYRSLSRLVNSIKDPSRFKFTTESLEMELLEYLELRNELFNDIEEVMGSYAQRAP
ncbi:hypothetical protein L0C50_26005, partial [Salmonella enterica subsp. enterica]|nr:hypothetical protein [Salmonella enterica subsp. enterica]